MILVWVPSHFSDFTMLNNKENTPPQKRPVATKGDKQLKLKTNFCDMLRLSELMTSALDDLLDLLNDGQPKKTDLNQARALAETLLNCSKQNGAFINDCMGQSSSRDFCRRWISEEVAKVNLERKR